MPGDANQAERHLNGAFRRHSGAALYCVNVIELQALSSAYYTPAKTTSRSGSTIFGNFEERKKEEIK
jgi:hypothetical protein